MVSSTDQILSLCKLQNFRVSVKRGVGVGVGVIFFFFFFLSFFFFLTSQVICGSNKD